MRPKRGLVKFVKLPKILDDCILSFAQSPNIPFKIKRVYFIKDANPKLPRGFHSHKKSQQAIFCLSGSITMFLDDGRRKKQVDLTEPNIGLLLDKLVWHEMRNFKKDTILLVLSSTIFNPNDYIRSYEQFKKITKKV